MPLFLSIALGVFIGEVLLALLNGSVQFWIMKHRLQKGTEMLESVMKNLPKTKADPQRGQYL